MKLEIEKRQLKRFTLLYELYKASNGKTGKVLDLLKIGANNDIKNGNFEEAKEYLWQEKFIYLPDSDQDEASITHLGKKVIEAAIMFPQQRSEHFASFNEMELK